MSTFHSRLLRGFRIGFVLFLAFVILYALASSFGCSAETGDAQSDGWVNYHKRAGPTIRGGTYSLIGPFEPPIWCSDPAVVILAAQDDSLYQIRPGQFPDSDSLYIALRTTDGELKSRRLSLARSAVVTYFSMEDQAWLKRLIWVE